MNTPIKDDAFSLNYRKMRWSEALRLKYHNCATLDETRDLFECLLMGNEL